MAIKQAHIEIDHNYLDRIPMRYFVWMDQILKADKGKSHRIDILDKSVRSFRLEEPYDHTVTALTALARGDYKIFEQIAELLGIDTQ